MSPYIHNTIASNVTITNSNASSYIISTNTVGIFIARGSTSNITIVGCIDQSNLEVDLP